jgi:hypothetical protein
MGEAKRKRAAIAAAEGQRDELVAAVARVGSACRRLFIAASAHLGSDCFTHAVIAQVLLADLGFDAHLKAGAVAWRVGPGDGDVLSHAPGQKAFTPTGMSPEQMAVAYHAWLVVHGNIVDVTTYQFVYKAQMLDTADGGHTTVLWRPDTLILPLTQVKTHREVAMHPDPGVAYYEAHPELLKLLHSTYSLDGEDVARARLLMANPELQAIGPNQQRAI